MSDFDLLKYFDNAGTGKYVNLWIFLGAFVYIELAKLVMFAKILKMAKAQQAAAERAARPQTAADMMHPQPQPEPSFSAGPDLSGGAGRGVYNYGPG